MTLQAYETGKSASDQTCDQERLLPFLCDPASYSHGPAGVELVQTHASFVFLAPPLVFKVKKAVDFGFLDFSTLEKRRHFCEREIELNRRLAHDVYLDVVPISLADGSLIFGEGEEVVEYAVRMRLLSEEGFLDRRLSRNEVSEEDLTRIAVTLREFYEAQHPTSEIEERGRVEALKVSTDENFRQTEEFVGGTLSRSAYETIGHYVDRFYVEQGDLFEKRVLEGRILDCHGDLHLEHIHLTPEAITIYDCIEFNDRFRYLDVASDLAFLAMDLDYCGRSDLSRYFLQVMAGELRDLGMGRLMDFYKCYRAYVRGKVESLHSVAHAAPEEERNASADRARRYFQMALRYAVSGSRPMVVVVMGQIAAGKSTLAEPLAVELGYDVFSSDRTRKELAGVPLHERGTSAERSRLYSPDMSAKTYDTLFLAAEEKLKDGWGVVVDASFGRRVDRQKLQWLLNQRGIDFCFLEVQAGPEALRRRLARREEKSDLISDARLEDFPHLSDCFEPPSELPGDHKGEIDTSGSAGESLSAALRVLAERRVSLA